MKRHFWEINQELKSIKSPLPANEERLKNNSPRAIMGGWWGGRWGCWSQCGILRRCLGHCSRNFMCSSALENDFDEIEEEEETWSAEQSLRRSKKKRERNRFCCIALFRTVSKELFPKKLLSRPFLISPSFSSLSFWHFHSFLFLCKKRNYSRIIKVIGNI